MTNTTFDLAENKKNNALNALHSLIYKIPNSVEYTAKLDGSVKALEKILLNYLELMYAAQQDDLYRRGYDSAYHEINRGPKAANYYNTAKHTYDIY